MALLIEQSRHKFFDDLANYLVCMISTTLTHELYIAGSAGKYSSNHIVQIDGKQVGRRFKFYPSKLLDEFFIKLVLPVQIRYDEELVTIDPGARLNLSVYERPLYAFAQAMFVNYFERYRLYIEQKHGADPSKWPAVWNFARVVRNTVAHGGCVHFHSASASAASWRGLTYSPSDNGRKVLFDDLWIGDLIYLMMDMDAQL